MDASLSRRTALVMQSPLWLSQSSPEASQNLIDMCVKANTFDGLPKNVQKFYETCEQSTEIAHRKGYRYPYSADEIADVLNNPEQFSLKLIKNKDRYPHVTWLEEAQPIGEIAQIPLVLLGYEQGTDDPIVSRDIHNEPYFAVPLSELSRHSQDPINITQQI